MNQRCSEEAADPSHPAPGIRASSPHPPSNRSQGRCSHVAGADALTAGSATKCPPRVGCEALRPRQHWGSTEVAAQVPGESLQPVLPAETGLEMGASPDTVRAAVRGLRRREAMEGTRARSPLLVGCSLGTEPSAHSKLPGA